MTESPPPPETDRSHYSYATYADAGMAEGFDQARFGGPIGRHLLETQERLLLEAVRGASTSDPRTSDPVRLRVLDVGTGTGRAAIGLARAGLDVIGLDASAEMLAVARRRATDAGVVVQFDVADAHALPIADRSVDVAVSLRVLMHVPDWPRCLSELCRVSRRRVVVDFPARLSLAMLESIGRRVGSRVGLKTEPYRCLAERDVARAFASHGFRVVTRHRQFVLPIALHKKIGSLKTTLGTERALASVGLLRLLGSPVTMVAER